MEKQDFAIKNDALRGLRKMCLVCDGVFYKPIKYSQKQWEAKRCCSKRCGLISIGKNPDTTIEERFWSKVIVEEDNSKCWAWVGGVDKKGYGRLNVDGSPKLAHRCSWEINRGVIPDGFLVRHLCNNPNCVNPNHLATGSHQQNSNDCRDGGRHGFKGSARFSYQEILLIRAACAKGMTPGEIGKIYNIKGDQIRKIVDKQTYQVVP